MPGDAVTLATLADQVVPTSLRLLAILAVGFLLLEAPYLLVWALFVTRWSEERGERRGRTQPVASP